MAQGPEFITISEAARRCKVSRKTVYNAVAQGRIPVAGKADRAVLVDGADVERWLEERRKGSRGRLPIIDPEAEPGWIQLSEAAEILGNTPGTVKSRGYHGDFPMARDERGFFYVGEDSVAELAAAKNRPIPRRKKRKCLSCGRMFNSRWEGERICPSCKSGRRPGRVDGDWVYGGGV